jgi:hypothetical protein
MNNESKLDRKSHEDGYPSQGNENPWQIDLFSDGYQENVFETNFGDTPYTESPANPNPKLRGYAKESKYQNKTPHSNSPSQLEL